MSCEELIQSARRIMTTRGGAPSQGPQKQSAIITTRQRRTGNRKVNNVENKAESFVTAVVITIVNAMFCLSYNIHIFYVKEKKRFLIVLVLFKDYFIHCIGF